MTRTEGEVSVTLLLNGGHSRTLYLAHRDPLLMSLVASIGEKSYGGGRPARPFNIHVEQGRQSIIFSSSDLVGLVTDPPLANANPSRQPNVPMTASEGAPAVEKSPYLLIESFIDPGRHADLLRFVLAREKEFVSSAVSAGELGYGKSLVLHDFPEFVGLIRDRVRSLLPQLAVAFGLGEFVAGDIESQLVARNDGHFCKLHSDRGTADALEHTISYVFYFHSEPKGYEGGGFRLYHGRIADGRYACGEPATEIEPKNNSILFFPSHCHHEVLPVRCDSRRFVDSSFTISGRVRRARHMNH